MPRHPVYLGGSVGNNNNLNERNKIDGRSQDIKVSGSASTTGLHLPGDAQPSDGESGRAQKHFGSSKDLAAIKNWLIEFDLHTKPYQEEAHINLNKTFYRFDFIVGTFERAMAQA